MGEAQDQWPGRLAPKHTLRLVVCCVAGVLTSDLIGDAPREAFGGFGASLVRIAVGVAASVLVWVVWMGVARARRGA